MTTLNVLYTCDENYAAYAGISILVFLITLITWIVNRASTRSQKKLLKALQITVPSKTIPTFSLSLAPSDAIIQYKNLKQKSVFALLILIFIPLCATLLLTLLHLTPSISEFATWVYFSNVWIPILLYALVGIIEVLIVSIFRIVRMRKILIHDHPDEWTAYVQKKPRSEKERKRMIADILIAGWILLSILHLHITSSVFTFVIYSIVFLLSFGYFLIRFYPRKHR